MFYTGIDWAIDHHDIAILNDTGEKISAFRIEQSSDGFYALRDRLRSLGVPKQDILIGIETSRLLLVDFLLNEGYPVIPINPKAIDRYRDRYTSSHAKSDSFDAEIIANALRTDRDRFHPLVPDSNLLRELRILVRDQKRLIHIQTRFFNQMKACLRDYYPIALELFTDPYSPIALDFFKHYPEPTILSKKKVERFFRTHRHSHPEQEALKISEKLSGKQIPVEEMMIRAKSRFLLTLIEQIQSLKIRIREYQDEIDKLFDQHPDSGIFKSLPGAGEKIAPRLLTEIGDNRDRYPDPDKLQCEAGTSPVTRSSGKSHIVVMRRACRKSFRDTMHLFSFCSLAQSSWSQSLYEQKKSQGKNHASALRSVGDKWLKIIHRIWMDRIPYDENVFLANQMRHQLSTT